MDIKITANQTLKVLQILSWIIFIGLCIEAGGLLFNLIYTFARNPVNTFHFWEGTDLSDLYGFDKGHYIVIVALMIIIAVLKAIVFYLIIKLFVYKKLNISRPFNDGIKRFLFIFTSLAFGIGLFSHFGLTYTKWLSRQQVEMPGPDSLNFCGADIWFFMAVTLFVVAHIVKRGIEIQNENDLTI